MRLKFMLLLAVLGALSACGGGGGGGGGGGSTPPPLASAVRVTNVAPASFTQDVAESSNPMAGFVITADVTGDLTRLNGETIFVVIEDARGLFEVASTEIWPNGVGNRVSLRLKSTQGLSGAVEATLRVNVCLDAACTRPLGNSPVLLPYRLNVFSGVRVAEAGPIVVDVPFGQAPLASSYLFATRRALQLSIPANIGSLNAIPPFETEWVGSSGSPSTDMLGLLSYGTVIPGQTIDGELVFERRPVGTYVSQLKLTTSLESVFGRAESLKEVRYIVRESGVRVAFDASRADFVDSGSQQFVNVTSANGVLYDRVSRIVYSPNSGSINWLTLSLASSQPFGTSRLFEVFANKCQFSIGCLSSGSYSADVYFQTATGAESPIAWRVTLQAL